MAFYSALAERIRKHLGKRAGLNEKKMFGGIGFLMRGNMCCGVHGSEMIVRLDPTETGHALKEPHTRLFDMTGRLMKGWLLVGPKGLAVDADLGRWVERAARYAGSLPPK